MINTTFSGLVFPGFSPGQMPGYWGKPVAFMNDLSSMQVSIEYSTAVIQHIEKSASEGQDFVEDMIRLSTWYEPPKGTNVDVYA